jgi:hypothetical protein
MSFFSPLIRCFHSKPLRLVGSLLLLGLPGLADAAEYPGRVAPVDFSLVLSNADVHLRTAGLTRHARLNRISATLFEARDARLQYGLLIGYSDLSLSNDAATAGLRLSGYHAGLALRGGYGNNPHLSFRLRLIYQQVEDELPARRITLSWTEWGTEVAARLRLGPRWAVTLGAGYTGLDGERRVSGDLNETLRMTLDASLQARLELAMQVPPGGWVGLGLQRGAFAGMILRFSRAF